MKRLLIGVLTVALAVGIVAPALGGPSIQGVAKLAKRADRKATRALNTTHPTDIEFVDGGKRTAPVGGFADWDVRCPGGTTAVGANVANGALDPVYAGSFGKGMSVTLGNPSATTPYEGRIQVACVWGPASGAASLRTPSRRAIEHQRQQAKRAFRSPAAQASKTCGPGYVHANLSWGEKCLHAGQYCKRGKNREYHRYGFHCKRNGHLRRW